MTELTDEQMLNVTGGYGSQNVFDECVMDQKNKKGGNEADAFAFCCKQLGDPRCHSAELGAAKINL